MSKIPFSTFEGYIKKLNLGQRPEIELVLFEHVFPQFFTKREIKQETWERTKASFDAFWPLLQVEKDLDPPRRFAGLPPLPRGRYYTICKSSLGDDNCILVKELRAYRDPKTSGRVGVADLVHEQLIGPPRPAIAVIIYEVDKIPFADQLLSSIPRASAKELLIYEYPCDVLEVRIERTIDLRLPIVQKWFFEQFSKEQNDGSIVWQTGKILARGLAKELQEQIEQEALIIMSRFQRKAGIAPIPTDFFAMLATLINPDGGGGITTEGGAILEAIGTWMRYNKANALIYPSARSDVFVELESGTIRDYGGWNLIDYRGTHPKGMKPFYVVPSPWA